MPDLDLCMGIHGSIVLCHARPAMSNRILRPRCGQPKVLRISQVYPAGYGKAVCKHHKTWMVARWNPLDHNPLSNLYLELVDPGIDFGTIMTHLQNANGPRLKTA